MVLYTHGVLKITAFTFMAIAVLLVALRFSPVIFPAMPEPSATFDCDDSALAMYRHFESQGIKAWPIIGNLDANGEAYMECNHVWLLVGNGDRKIAYDWGLPRLDSQHYEGYFISLDKLLLAVERDKISGDGGLAAAE